MRSLGALIACCFGFVLSCAGTEGDVLSRQPTDLGTDGGDMSADAGTGFVCQTGGASGPCQLESSWAQLAEKDCQGMQLSLQSYLPAQPLCADGKSYAGVTFVCCPAAIVMGCVNITEGILTTPQCQDSASWKMQATANCAVSMFTLAGLTLLDPGGACGQDNYGGASYVCCP